MTAIETQNSFHKVLNGLLMKQGPFVGSCYLSEWFTMYLDLYGYFCPLIILHDPYFSRKGGPGAPQVKFLHINTSYALCFVKFGDLLKGGVMVKVLMPHC